MTLHRLCLLISAEGELLALARSRSTFAPSLRATHATGSTTDDTRLTATHVRSWTRKPFAHSRNGSTTSGATNTSSLEGSRHE